MTSEDMEYNVQVMCNCYDTFLIWIQDIYYFICSKAIHIFKFTPKTLWILN